MSLESETSTGFQMDSDLQIAVHNKVSRALDIEASHNNSIASLFHLFAALNEI